MSVLEGVNRSIRSIKTHRLRSFLTMLGMIIGISAVIIIMSVGAGAQSLVLNQIRGIGSDLINVLPGKAIDDGPPASVLGIVITTLTLDDALALAEKRNVKHVTSVAAYLQGVGTAQYRDQDENVTFVGTLSTYPEVEGASVAQGRFFDESEEFGIHRVAVLGSEIAKNLFPNENPVGKEIRLKREQFKVIGVLEERGTVFFVNQDNNVVVPLETAQKILLGVDHVGMIRAKVDEQINLDQSVEEIRSTLRERHDIENPEEDDFLVRSSQQGIDVITQVTDVLRFFLVFIAAIALLVGGIGIMNIMLVAVNERIREIGLRKAVGATRGNILAQFLVETIVLSLFGGAIGVAIGVVISGIVAFVAQYLGYDWNFVVTFGSIALAAGFSIAVGLIFGTYPAWKASKLDPLTALRYE